METFRRFVIVELVALAALLIVAGAMAAYGAIDSASYANSLVDPTGSAWLGFAYTLAIGALPVACIGAPVYLLLLMRGSAKWLNVSVLGTVPGVLLLLVAFELGLLAIVCGLAVALLTHFVCRRLGPNNSSKPTPLRGAA